MKTISVIAVKCAGVGSDLRSYGEWLANATFRNIPDAVCLAQSLRAEGICVVVRPNFNDPGNRSFREWRSFNGSDFAEVVFRI
jgi:hypothetical protein